MIVEIYKQWARECGSIENAIKEGYGLEWTPERIKGAFNFGRGTEKDLKEWMERNKTLCYFIEI